MRATDKLSHKLYTATTGQIMV